MGKQIFGSVGPDRKNIGYAAEKQFCPTEPDVLYICRRNLMENGAE